jgi:hypothetical protein
MEDNMFTYLCKILKAFPFEHDSVAERAIWPGGVSDN